MSEQIAKDLGRDLFEKISAAYRHAFQLCDDTDMAFKIAAMGLSAAMGATAGALDAMAGEGPSSDPLSVAKAIIEQMMEARGDTAVETPATVNVNLERQNSDLQASNNRLLERARAAEAMTELSQAARDVLAERRRQIIAEGWTPEHDDAHSEGDLSNAAACYAAGEFSDIWPWDESWWKPTTRRRDLVKAGALILAEIERIDRHPHGGRGLIDE